MFKQISCIFSFSLLLLFPFSNSTRISMNGDDWLIIGNRSSVTRGEIPGTIHTILLAANKIPEPYFGYNDVNLRSLVYSSWIFTKNFSLTPDFLAFTQFTLYFDQIDTVANITLNGCFIGQTSSMFIPYTFDVMRSCIHSDNQLRIDFQSPITYALNQAEKYNYTLLPTCSADIQHEECHIQFIRKEICSFSWDWVRHEQIDRYYKYWDRFFRIDSFLSTLCLFRVQLSRRLVFRVISISTVSISLIYPCNLKVSTLPLIRTMSISGRLIFY
jgi:hypothetical protein